MPDDNKPRMMELKSLLLNKSFSEISDVKISELIALEQKMSENRAALISLLDGEILNEVEVEGKIELCFNVFLKNVVKLLGAENCKAIYDFLPGETLTFYRPEKKIAAKVLNETDVYLEKALRLLRESRSRDPRRVLIYDGGRTEYQTPKRDFWVADDVVLKKQQKQAELKREEIVGGLKILLESIEKQKKPSRNSMRAQQRMKRNLAGIKKTQFGLK